MSRSRVTDSVARPIRLLLLMMLWSSGSPPAAVAISPDVREFLNRSYFHGIPYEDARALGPDALPALERALADTSLKSKWSSVITSIAYIGTPNSFRILRQFMWSRFSGPVDTYTWRALLTVPNVLGTIPDSPDAPVVRYLEHGTNPAFWDSLPWTETFHEERGDLGLVLSEVSINGLGCTGSVRAAVVLARLREEPYSQRQIPNIEEAIRVNQEVRANGVSAYLKRVQQKLGASWPGRSQK